MPGLKKTKIGKVVSNKMDKTAVVEVSRKVKHPRFQKYFMKRKKFKVHDEENRCQVGDQVMIKESLPISKHKHWVVTQIISSAVQG